MWERCRGAGRGRRRQGRPRPAPGDQRPCTATGGAVGGRPPTADGATDQLTACRRTSISSMPLGELVRAMDPPAPAEVRAAARRAALPRLPHRRPGRARRSALPRQLDLRAHPGVRVGRIQNFGAWSPYMVKDGRTCLGPGVLRLRGRRAVANARRRAGRAGHARARAARAGRPGVRRGRLRRADAEGVPGVRRELRGATSTTMRELAGRPSAERASGGAQRDAPLQQPGPLDAHRDARGREHRRRRRRTTSGRSTSRSEYHEEGRGTGRDAPVLPHRAAVPG